MITLYRSLATFIVIAATGLGCARAGSGAAAAPGVAGLPPALVSFSTTDQGVIFANAYGRGDHAVVLGSNGCLTKEGWDPQARALALNGFRALAIDFRGQGQSRKGRRPESREDDYHLDVLAAVRYLHETGARRVSIIGASCAGDAAAQASVEARAGEIDRLVLLAHGGIAEPERMKGRKLFVVTRADANDAGLRLPRIREQYERAPEPKELLILGGSAHGQRIFATEQGEHLMRAILQFLSRP